MAATILMIFVGINCENVIGLAWRRHTKFQIGVGAALPPMPLSAPLGRV